MASVAAGSKVSQLFCCPFDALGSTMATYGGQNVGAGRLERIGKGLKSCSAIGIVYSLAAFAVLSVFGGNLAQMFMDAKETQVIANAALFLAVNSAAYIPLAFVNIVRFLIQGLGFTRQAVFAGVLEMAARVIVGVVMVPAFGYIAVCAANPSAWVAADLFLFPAYGWAMRRLVAARESEAKKAPAMPGDTCKDAPAAR